MEGFWFVSQGSLRRLREILLKHDYKELQKNSSVKGHFKFMRKFATDITSCCLRTVRTSYKQLILAAKLFKEKIRNPFFLNWR